VTWLVQNPDIIQKFANGCKPFRRRCERRERLQTMLGTLRTSKRRNERSNVLAGPSPAVPGRAGPCRPVAGRQDSHTHSLEKAQGERGRNLKTFIS